MTHTPGPWSLTRFGKDDWAVGIEQDKGEPLLQVVGYHKMSEANALLIAAAPDLLDNHIENARILRFLWSELQGRVDAGKLAGIYACLCRCNESIAKATGE